MNFHEFVTQNNIVIRIPPQFFENLVYFPKTKSGKKQKHAWLGSVKLFPLN